MTVTRTEVSGAELKPGDVFKHSRAAHGGRIYLVVHLEDADHIGARYGDFRQTNGEIVCFNVFTDSVYELRTSTPRPRKRIVKVDAADLALILPRVSLENATEDVFAALRRLKSEIGV